jgi:predicted Fe-Mo cluster-binding NifX family protein
MVPGKEKTVKVIVTSQGKTMDSQVDPRFGRTQYFMVVDTDTWEYETVGNAQNVNAIQGAGIQAGQKALNLGARVVITGHVGPKAFATLLAADIEVYINASGTVKDAVEAYKAGKLTQANRPDVQGHW